MAKKRKSNKMDMLNGDWAVFDRKIIRAGNTWAVSLKPMLKDMGYLPGDTVTVAILKPGKKIITRYSYKVIEEDAEEKE